MLKKPICNNNKLKILKIRDVWALFGETAYMYKFCFVLSPVGSRWEDGFFLEEIGVYKVPDVVPSMLLDIYFLINL